MLSTIKYDVSEGVERRIKPGILLALLAVLTVLASIGFNRAWSYDYTFPSSEIITTTVRSNEVVEDKPAASAPASQNHQSSFNERNASYFQRNQNYNSKKQIPAAPVTSTDSANVAPANSSNDSQTNSHSGGTGTSRPSSGDKPGTGGADEGTEPIPPVEQPTLP